MSKSDSTYDGFGPGKALVRDIWLGIDPTQRTWLNTTATYASPAPIGAVMPTAVSGWS